MPNYAKYPLPEGYIHQWLLAGPFEPAPGPQSVGAAAASTADTYFQSIELNQPVEFERVRAESVEGQWNTFSCAEDHWIDLSDYPGEEVWGTVEVYSPEEISTEVIVTSFGPAELWIGGERVIGVARFETGSFAYNKRTATLRKGKNQVSIRFTRGHEPPHLLAAAVCFKDCPECLVMLPVASEMLANRKDLQKAFTNAYLDQYVYAEKDPIILRWQKAYSNHCNLAVQLRRAEKGSIVGYIPQVTAEADKEPTLLQPFEVPDGRFSVRLMPSMDFYTNHHLRIQRDLPFYTAKNRFTSRPEEPIGSRVDEAVAWAVQRVDDFFGQAIKMAAGRWKVVDFEQVERLAAQGNLPPLLQAGLALVTLRYSQSEQFAPELRETLLAYLQKANDPAAAEGEGDELCAHTFRLLAKQAAGAEKTARRRASPLAQQITAWIAQRLAYGFRDWNDSAEMEKLLLALTLLVDFALDEELQEYAGVLLDKIFFHMAIHHLRGVPVTPRKRTALPHALSARFDPLAPVMRLMWGQGAPNIHLAGTAAMLSVRGYQLPELIRQIALNEAEGWLKERHADPQTGDAVNLVTYKTPDYLLSSAQDYRPGAQGRTEQLWQAALSPDAIVTTTHPLRFSLSETNLPNFWCGSHSLPRIGQWKNTLIAVYHLPEDDWNGFTHAYFPAHAFDEFQVGPRWAFARKGDGYLALCASQDLEWITQGDSAYRELRSYGREHVWVCQMGRQALDGSFTDFQEKVLAAEARLTTDDVIFQPRGSDRLEFGWHALLRVNGEEIALKDFLHYDTPYSQVAMSAEQMEIHFSDESIRLRFS